ncbi:hypothetical protein [Arsenicicoccus piscis]|uniref:hypothetical protein n=1 Tax=Arsenicicoccus piscis TaxID=673954 RepID=UPI0024E189FF|nr:hypothetical protein [Arsenicicoccus piscis]
MANPRTRSARRTLTTFFVLLLAMAALLAGATRWSDAEWTPSSVSTSPAAPRWCSSRSSRAARRSTRAR